MPGLSFRFMRHSVSILPSLSFRSFIIITAVFLSLGAYAFGGKSAPSGDSTNASSSSVETVWVSRSDGSQSCATDSGQSLEQGANDLKRAHINVVSSQKGNDTKVHAQGCGLPTGHVNAYEIQKSDLAKANVLGYQQVK
jgi:hypothetical protein